MQTWERILEKYHILRRKNPNFIKQKFCSTHFYDFLMRIRSKITLLYQIWGVVNAAGSYFTHDFAVELRSDQDPDQIARAHACVNLGEFLPGIFHFKHQKVHRRSASQSNVPKFHNDHRILSAVQQKTKNRVKRDFVEDNRPPKDPLYPRMFYLDPSYPGRQSGDDIRHMNITGAWAQEGFLKSLSG